MYIYIWNVLFSKYSFSVFSILDIILGFVVGNINKVRFCYLEVYN